MRRALALCALLAIGAGALPAADPPSPFPQPAPVPQPMPAPVGSVLSLGSDQFYVFSEADGALAALPAGLVTITKSAGPQTLKGRFAGGTGGVETRVLAGPFVYSVDAVPGASGRVHLIFTRSGFKAGDPQPTTCIDVGESKPAPKPPVPPKPDPTPAPEPKPVPPVPVDPPAPVVVGEGAWVIVVNDESQPAPASLTGAALTRLVNDGRGHVYGSKTDAAKIKGKGYDAIVKEAGVTGSALIVLGQPSADRKSKALLVIALPATDAEVGAKLKGLMPGF